MAYIRCDKDCNPTVQPGNINVTDTFNNTNDFFHVDYQKTDKDCNPVAMPIDPNVPQNNLRAFDTTVLPNGRGGILFFDTNWTRRLSDNSGGSKQAYVRGFTFPLNGTHPPGHPQLGSGTFIVLPTDTYSNTDILDPVYLASESDDDLWIVDESNVDIFVVDFVEPISVTPSGTVIGQLVITEDGVNEVVSESSNPVTVE